ncbi:Angiogenic factor with G patch and FHA domains 1 [Lunasporangiospora selenospora]|uniref:Angiogenic factor with G patch and FHA domains 1 n=1 Tax=Lunasporangiospora selenospora TaxID=979761 RepID=A0A9P6FZD5_9FUNG|nr:Angiogenic factor with G patch and FHA domains 1 [Lunasporangiospora selenospora]
MANFDDELDGYLKARIASEAKEASGQALPFPHPAGFQPSPDAPSFAQHPETQMWHDGSTGTFSYYDASSGTYIPVEGSDSSFPVSYSGNHQFLSHYQQQQQQQQQAGLYNEYTEEFAATPAYAGEAPPESDATLRLCVIASKTLPVGGVILMDASGLSFGRDRPLSGQGKRVRMQEMEISRFHANIYLDRQQYVPDLQSPATHDSQPANENSKPKQEKKSQRDMEHVSGPPVELSAFEGRESDNADTPTEGQYDHVNDESKPDKEALDSPLRDAETPLDKEFSDIQDEEGEKEEGELPDSPKDSQHAPVSSSDDTQEGDIPKTESETDSKDLEQQYADYQYQLEQYHHYYQQQQLHPIPVYYIDTFKITDSGSTHGTFLNQQRLSEPRTASQPFALSHLDQLLLGSTMLEVHAHDEGRICERCQVTDANEILVLDDMTRGGGGGGDSANERGLDNSTFESSSGLPRSGGGGHGENKYVDRAAKRRLYKPDNSPVISSTPPSTTAATFSAEAETTTGFHIPVSKTNKGHAMLSKMGWKAGMGLGASRQGTLEPVQLKVAEESRAGLGATLLQTQGAAAVTASTRAAETQGEIARRKARERFSRMK